MARTPRQEGFYLRSPQTRRTRVVNAFIDRVAPNGIRNAGDVEAVVLNIRAALRTASHHELVSGASCNEELNRRAGEIYSCRFASPPGGDRDPAHLIHLSAPGVRTADEIVRDGFVSKAVPCTDYNTLLMAALRKNGIPCRLTRVVMHGLRKQSSFTEAIINGKSYRIAPVTSNNAIVQRGIIPQRDGLTLITARDHHASGVDVRELVANLSANRVPIETAVRRALGIESR